MKKILCLVLSLCMVVCFSTVSWAEPNVYNSTGGWNGGTANAANGKTSVTYSPITGTATFTVTIPSTITGVDTLTNNSTVGDAVTFAPTKMKYNDSVEVTIDDGDPQLWNSGHGIACNILANTVAAGNTSSANTKYQSAGTTDIVDGGTIATFKNTNNNTVSAYLFAHVTGTPAYIGTYSATITFTVTPTLG